MYVVLVSSYSEFYFGDVNFQIIAAALLRHTSPLIACLHIDFSQLVENMNDANI